MITLTPCTDMTRPSIPFEGYPFEVYDALETFVGKNRSSFADFQLKEGHVYACVSLAADKVSVFSYTRERGFEGEMFDNPDQIYDLTEMYGSELGLEAAARAFTRQSQFPESASYLAGDTVRADSAGADFVATTVVDSVDYPHSRYPVVPMPRVWRKW